MIFYDNPDFYPTPNAVIERMLTDDSPAGLVVLEPSAGSGNIVRKLNEHGAAEVLACETDENLRRVLGREKCRIIASDFLTVTAEQVSHVQMIVMNPPFSHGCRHILHAYEIAPAGCCIIALVNESNLKQSYYTEYKKLQELRDLYGFSEDLGEVFAEDAERRTRCRVSLVKLWKPGNGAHEFDGYFSAFDEDTQAVGGDAEGLIQYNFLRDIVNRYCEAVKLFDGVMQATEQINRAATFVDYRVETDESTGEQRAIRQEYGALPIMFRAVTNKDMNREINHQTYRKELQKYYWGIIFKKMNMEKYATQELKRQINRFVEQRQNVPFTMANIYRVIETVAKTRGQRMNNAVCEAFDTICSLSAENSTAGETWKTNANYMVNRRFICDWVTEHRRDSVDIRISGNGDRIEDVCKALCYLTGRNWDDIGSLYSHVRRTCPDWGKWFEWGFFRCKGFKKGTMHFEFLDKETWETFNRTAAEAKGWKLGKRSN